MAHMVSPAGDMDVRITHIGIAKGQLFISGQIGVWDSQIYFARDEVARLAKLMLSPSLLKYMVVLPFALLSHKFSRRRKHKG